MNEIMFRYDYPSRTWVRAEDEAFTGRPEELTSIVVMNQPASRMVWCDAHQACEKVAEWKDGELTTEDGCRMRGLVCEIPYPERTHWYDPPLERVSRVMRWRVSYREEDGTVLILSDVAQMVLGDIYDNKKKSKNRIPKVRSFVCKSVMIRLAPISILPKKVEPDIPSPVADAAIEFLVGDLRASLILVPSFSTGDYPFKMISYYGFPYDCHIVWINTCAAEHICPVGSRPLDTVGMIYNPGKSGYREKPIELKRSECNRQCTECLKTYEADIKGEEQ